MSKEDTPTCPRCGSTDVASILWGYPAFGEQLERDLDEDRVVLGGCILEDDSPKWHCNNCKKEFGHYNDEG